MSDKQIVLVFMRIAELATAMGLGKGALVRQAGTWRYKLREDGRWELELNAHREPESSTMLPGTTIEAFNCCVQYNGWPFAFLNPMGGPCGAGEAANENTLIEALEKEIKSYGAELEDYAA